MSSISVRLLTGEAGTTAGRARTISRGTSPWVNNLKFRFTGYAFGTLEADGKPIKRKDGSVATCPLLTTSLGEGNEMFFSMLTKPKLGADGHSVKPEGEVNLLAERIIRENRTKTDEEILKAFFDEVKDKEIIVSRESFAMLTTDGRRVPGSLVVLNFAQLLIVPT